MPAATPAATRARSRATRLRALARHLQMSRRAELAPRLLQQASRQDEAADGDWDEDAGHLVQAADAALDEALEAFQGGQVDQGVALVVAAAASVDALLEAMNLPDADEGQPDANANSRRPAGSTRATPPTDTHAGERYNAHDIGFLHEVGGQLQGGIGAAHAVLRQGIHPDTAALAQSLLSTNTDHLVTAAQLQQRLAPASGASGAVAAVAASTSGHGSSGGGGGGGGRGLEMRATTPAKPYGDVAYADPGYQKDKKKRYPIDSAAHVKAAWSYINQGDNASQYTSEQLVSIKARIKAAAKKFGIQISQANSARQPSEIEERDVAFEMVPHADGLTLEGYAAVFNSPTRISGWEGDFEETIQQGAFAQTLHNRTPVLMFEHGKHPLIGSMPLGVIQRAEEDTKGVYVQARLSDNWLIQPVRDAVRDGAVTGMSFRFEVPEGGDRWLERKSDVPLRTLLNVSVRELGPVVFPAYEPTTAAVRSALDHLSGDPLAPNGYVITNGANQAVTLMPALTGRPSAWSAGGGDFFDAKPGHGEASSPSLSAEQTRRDRELRIRRIIRV